MPRPRGTLGQRQNQTCVLPPASELAVLPVDGFRSSWTKPEVSPLIPNTSSELKGKHVNLHSFIHSASTHEDPARTRLNLAPLLLAAPSARKAEVGV